jgi:hypothetical protein
MKPRVGVYPSEGMAARLAEAAKSPRATKSALVEAALDRYFGSDDDVSDTATVARHLAGLSRRSGVAAFAGLSVSNGGCGSYCMLS